MGCVFAITVVSILLLAEFDDHREDAQHFILIMVHCFVISNSGFVLIFLQIVVFFRSHMNHTFSNLDLSDYLNDGDFVLPDQILFAEKPVALPQSKNISNSEIKNELFSSTSLNITLTNNFTVICDKSFKEDDLIMATYWTRESFDGIGWIGLVPADIVHYNESINWRHSYAHFRIDGKSQ